MKVASKTIRGAARGKCSGSLGRKLRRRRILRLLRAKWSVMRAIGRMI